MPATAAAAVCLFLQAKNALNQLTRRSCSCCPVFVAQFVNVCMLLDATFMSWARVQDDWSRDLRRGLQAYATKHKLPGGQPALAPQAEGNQRKA